MPPITQPAATDIAHHAHQRKTSNVTVAGIAIPPLALALLFGIAVLAPIIAARLHWEFLTLNVAALGAT